MEQKQSCENCKYNTFVKDCQYVKFCEKKQEIYFENDGCGGWIMQKEIKKDNFKLRTDLCICHKCEYNSDSDYKICNECEHQCQNLKDNKLDMLKVLMDDRILMPKMFSFEDVRKLIKEQSKLHKEKIKEIFKKIDEIVFCVEDLGVLQTRVAVLEEQYDKEFLSEGEK